jgi:uncharacterized membrane protein YkoI
MSTHVRGGVAMALLLVAGIASGDEKKIKISDLPEKVLTAVKQKFPGAEITGAEQETENGKTIYEVAVKHQGQKIEAEFTPDGEFLEMDTMIDVKELPKAVAGALKQKYPNATLKGAEKVTKKDDSVLYEVAVEVGDKKGEVVVDPDGKIVKDLQPEKKE